MGEQNHAKAVNALIDSVLQMVDATYSFLDIESENLQKISTYDTLLADALCTNTVKNLTDLRILIEHKVDNIKVLVEDVTQKDSPL